MKAAIYARVSTEDQNAQIQLREFSDYCHGRRWLTHDMYVDEGISSAKASRPQLNRLVADAHRRLFDVVVVWKFDRFARSTSHLLHALETFQALGIDFVSMTDGIDTSTPAGKMVFTFLAAVAEFERNLNSERVKAGLRYARAQGKHIGRPGRELDPWKISTLRREGKKWREISQELGIAVSTAYKAARNHLEAAPGATSRERKGKIGHPADWRTLKRPF